MEGKACHRSNYGVQTYTPEETKNQWKEIVQKNHIIQRTHKCATKERSDMKKIEDGGPNETSYFNNNKKHTLVSKYDRQFHVDHGYHSKLTRDDRLHVLGLNVNAEECDKKVPILSSSAYGHRQSLEMTSRKYCRVSLVQRDFFRDCGTNIPCGKNDL